VDLEESIARADVYPLRGVGRNGVSGLSGELRSIDSDRARHHLLCAFTSRVFLRQNPPLSLPPQRRSFETPTGRIVDLRPRAIDQPLPTRFLLPALRGHRAPSWR
jgi:hypothetical protein